jgi:methylmalonyl-CoA/ethylmalonyl-CoA epimerase
MDAAFCRGDSSQKGVPAMRAEDTTLAAELEDVPGIQCIDHVAIAVPQGELEGQVAAYALLGFREIHREEVRGSDMVREALLQIGNGPSMIQLLEPLSAESPVQKLIEKNGGHGGFAHVAFRVKSAREAFDSMKGNGFRIIDAAPRAGSRGTTVFFVHPKSEFGILLEMVEAGESLGSLQG